MNGGQLATLLCYVRNYDGYIYDIYARLALAWFAWIGSERRIVSTIFKSSIQPWNFKRTMQIFTNRLLCGFVNASFVVLFFLVRKIQQAINTKCMGLHTGSTKTD